MYVFREVQSNQPSEKASSQFPSFLICMHCGAMILWDASVTCDNASFYIIIMIIIIITMLVESFLLSVASSLRAFLVQSFSFANRISSLLYQNRLPNERAHIFLGKHTPTEIGFGSRHGCFLHRNMRRQSTILVEYEQ